MSDGTMSAFMAGVLLGSFVLGKLADSLGRKNILTGSTAGLIFFNSFSAISATYLMYVVAKFCVGFFCAGTIISSLVLGKCLLYTVVVVVQDCRVILQAVNLLVLLREHSLVCPMK